MYQEMYDLPFRASDYEPSEGFTPVPAGDYQVMVVDANIDLTRNQESHLFKVTYQVTEGEFVNRKLWSQHNIDHRNPEAQNIARREVSALAHAINRPDAERMQDYLHGRCQVSVVIRQDEGYDPKNVIKGWKTVDGQKPKRRAEFRNDDTGQERHRPVPGTAETGAAAGLEGQTPAQARAWERPQGEPVTARTASNQPPARAVPNLPDGEKLTGTETTGKAYKTESTSIDSEIQRRERIQDLSREALGIPESTDNDQEVYRMALESIQNSRTLAELKQTGKDLEDKVHPDLAGELRQHFMDRMMILDE